MVSCFFWLTTSWTLHSKRCASCSLAVQPRDASSAEGRTSRSAHRQRLEHGLSHRQLSLPFAIVDGRRG
eukprot:415864-Pyramimonas_sp.AAC.1